MNRVSAWKKVRLDPERLYDAEGYFTIEAELIVDQEESKDGENPKKSDFVKDIEGIFFDVKTADVEVIAGKRKFNCHKNILSARCEVFKNMLGPNTLESESNTSDFNFHHGRQIPIEWWEQLEGGGDQVHEVQGGGGGGSGGLGQVGG